MKNIAYSTEQLAQYFASNRVKWEQFYESERVLIERLDPAKSCAVLDIGCGCGGLGLALRERFGMENYTGVEINESAAAAGRVLNPHAQMLCGDILDLTAVDLRDRRFDLVFSLSCVDWNVRFEDMLTAAWRHVRPGGNLIATFRLTRGNGCSDFAHSYQFINYAGKQEGERAAYVVLNARELIVRLGTLEPAEVCAFGYWGAPSVTAVTPYEQLCFAAFAVRRRKLGQVADTRYSLDLPDEILDAIGPLES